MFQIRTIRQGQRVAVWDKRGRLQCIDRPRLLFLDEQMRRLAAERRAKADARRESNQIALEHRQALNQEKTKYLSAM